MIFGNTGNVEKEEYLEPTTESISMILEVAVATALNPEELDAFLESADVQTVQREDILLERSIVRLDKKARLSHAQQMAVFTIAKEKNDPQFKKLLTVWRMERFLEDKLNQRYGNEALRRAKAAIAKGSNSKSAAIKKATNNMSKQLNSGIKRVG